MSYSPAFLDYLRRIRATVEEYESSSMAERSAVMKDFRSMQFQAPAGKFAFKYYFILAIIHQIHLFGVLSHLISCLNSILQF